MRRFSCLILVTGAFVTGALFRLWRRDVPRPRPLPPRPPSRRRPRARRRPPSSTRTPPIRTPEQRARDEARAPLANAMVDAFPNAQPRFSPDLKKLLFSSRRDGNRDLSRRGREPLGPAHPAHARDRRAAEATFTRDGNPVLFLRDTGADENFRIYRVGVDGKDVPDARPRPGTESCPSSRAASAARLCIPQRDVQSPATEVVVQSLAGGEPEIVDTDPGTGSRRRRRPRRQARRADRHCIADAVLFEVDLQTAKARRIFPAEGKEGRDPRRGDSADGKHLVVASDDGAEAQLLLMGAPATESFGPKTRYTETRRRPRLRPSAFPRAAIGSRWRLPR